MSLDQLNYFVAVAEEGNIGRAARRLHISQPPLSRQIRSLEHELGVALFLRTAQGVQLLPAGHQLLPRARDILDAVAGVRLCVRRTAEGDTETQSHAAAASTFAVEAVAAHALRD